MTTFLFPSANDSVFWRVGWHGSLLAILVQLICWFVPAMPARMQAWLWRLAIVKFAIVLFWLTPLEVPVLPSSHVGLAVTEPRHSVATESLESASSSSGGMGGVPLIWLVGSGWCLTQIGNAYRRSIRFLQGCRPVIDPQLRDEFTTCVQSLRLRRRPQLLEFAGAGSPFVVGVFRPLVVLPKQTLMRMAEADRQMTIRHELAHLKRNDLVWNVVAALVRSLLFFHPLVWWAERQLRTAHEMSADEWAIRSQGCDPVDYGKMLVSIVRQSGTAEFHPTIAVGAAGSIGMLTRRLAAMRFMNRVTRRVVLGSAACVVLIAAVGIIPWRLVSFRATPESPVTPLLSMNADQGTPARSTAKIRITRCTGKQDQAVLFEPTVEYSERGETRISIDNDFAIDVEMETDRQQSPFIHKVRVKFIEKPQSQSPGVTFAPRVSMYENSSATVQTLNENGDGLKVDVAISSGKSQG